MSIGTSQKHFKGTAVIGFSYRDGGSDFAFATHPN